MKVEVLNHPFEDDWLAVKQRALVTIGKKSTKYPDESWKQVMLNCRHSPIRYLEFSFYLSDIPYWLHTELVRHHIGVQFYVKSQRDDRSDNDIPRAEKPQGALVDMIMDVNADALLTIMNKRLCGAATKEMQNLMLMIRKEVINTNPEFKDFLVPMCIYHGNKCKEFKNCGGKAEYFSRKN